MRSAKEILIIDYLWYFVAFFCFLSIKLFGYSIRQAYFPIGDKRKCLLMPLKSFSRNVCVPVKNSWFILPTLILNLLGQLFKVFLVRLAGFKL